MIRSEMSMLEVQQDCRKRPRTLQKKLLEWYGRVIRMKEEHIVRRMLDMDIPGKRRRERPNIRWITARKRDMTEAGLKVDNTINRTAWRNTIIR